MYIPKKDVIMKLKKKNIKVQYQEVELAAAVHMADYKSRFSDH